MARTLCLTLLNQTLSMVRPIQYNQHTLLFIRGFALSMRQCQYGTSRRIYRRAGWQSQCHPGAIFYQPKHGLGRAGLFGRGFGGLPVYGAHGRIVCCVLHQRGRLYNFRRGGYRNAVFRKQSCGSFCSSGGCDKCGRNRARNVQIFPIERSDKCLNINMQK